MTTARQIITKALQKNGVLVKSEAPDTDEANDGLDALNDMLDSFSNDSLIIYARAWENFTLVGGVGDYTIGAGGDFNTVRPTNIVEAYCKIGESRSPIGVIDDESYNALTFPTLPSIPAQLNYDGGYPLGKIRFTPYPSSAYPLFLLTEKPLTGFDTLDTVVSLPPGYKRMMIYNLAIELAPEYNQPVKPEIAKIANDSYGLISAKIAQLRGMDAYPQGGGVRNIYTGWRA